MAVSEYIVKINYETQYGEAPSQFIYANGNYTVTANEIPTLEYEGYMFTGWYCNDELIQVGQVLTAPSGGGTSVYTFTAVWQKQTVYVLMNKDDLTAMADKIREKTGSTETINTASICSKASGIIDCVDASTIPVYDCVIEGSLAPNVNYVFDAMLNDQITYGALFPATITGGLSLMKFRRGSLFYAEGAYSFPYSEVSVTGDIEIIQTGKVNVPVVLKINGNGTIVIAT